MNTYNWLLVLGFEPTVAAAIAMPEIFRVEETDDETIRLAADRARLST